MTLSRPHAEARRRGELTRVVSVLPCPDGSFAYPGGYRATEKIGSGAEFSVALCLCVSPPFLRVSG